MQEAGGAGGTTKATWAKPWQQACSRQAGKQVGGMQQGREADQLTCESVTAMVSANTNHSTNSEQGGVVSDPT